MRANEHVEKIENGYNNVSESTSRAALVEFCKVLELGTEGTKQDLYL